MKNLQPGTALRNGERERILIRCREALAGYRGAALIYRFGAGIVMAVLQKHILSRFQFLNLRVPGAAPDQSRSASGVYTGLVCWHECDNQESALCGRRKMLQQSVSRICDTEDIPLPRSLTRCARSFGCGERCRLTGGAEISRKKLNREATRPRRSRFSIGSAPLTSITKSDAQISGGETRQDLKIPGVSPWWLPRALSCSCLSVYRRHSAVMAAFISFHA